MLCLQWFLYIDEELGERDFVQQQPFFFIFFYKKKKKNIANKKTKKKMGVGGSSLAEAGVEAMPRECRSISTWQLSDSYFTK